MNAQPVVHIVDDDGAVRRSLERLLYAAGFASVPYSTANEVLAAIASLVTGCILMDVRMPGMDGLALQARLTALGVRLPIIVMTGQGDVSTAVQAMKAGAVDFIEKPFDDTHLLDVITGVLADAGRAPANPEAVQASRRIAALSPREKEVLDALVVGHANKIIAGDLGISVRTVEVHRARMLQRLGVRKLAEAVRMSVLAESASTEGGVRSG